MGCRQWGGSRGQAPCNGMRISVDLRISADALLPHPDTGMSMRDGPWLAGGGAAAGCARHCSAVSDTGLWK